MVIRRLTTCFIPPWSSSVEQLRRRLKALGTSVRLSGRQKCDMMSCDIGACLVGDGACV